MAFYTVYLAALFNLFDLSELPPGQTSQTHSVQTIYVRMHRNDGCIVLPNISGSSNWKRNRKANIIPWSDQENSTDEQILSSKTTKNKETTRIPKNIWKNYKDLKAADNLVSNLDRLALAFRTES